ncbi:MAG TPA: mechanosensitive ion channel family protein, partial [Methanocella sp.]|nr:mechanosensitive ion channel family protein [Methanocella sp.]
MQELGPTLSANSTQTANASTAVNISAINGFSIDVHPLASPIQSLIVSITGVNGIAADIATATIIFIVFLLLSWVARYFVKHIAPLVSRTESTLDDEILLAIKGPITALIIVLGGYIAIKSADNLSLGIITTLDQLAFASLLLVAAYLTSNLISGFLRWYARDVAPRTESDLDDHLIPFIDKLSVVVIYILAFLLVLQSYGIGITALLASMGVAGIAVALAAQESLSNVFGAVAIMMDRPYKIGDRLLIPDIGQGDVLDIGMRSTRIITRNRQVVVIPNREMANADIVNLSMPDSRLRLRLKVGVAYKTDMDRACRLLEEIAAENPLVVKDPAPGAHISSLGDFAVEISLLAWIADYREDYDVTDQLYRQILVRFRKENIEISYPIMT